MHFSSLKNGQNAINLGSLDSLDLDHLEYMV
jgi:hypothetical protein